MQESKLKEPGYPWHDKADPILYPQLLEYAKENRRHPTEAENILWNVLKAKGIGVPFLRQFIIDQFIVDFAYKKGRLVIEVDGGYHSEYEQMEKDEFRTERLNAMGFTVIRFSNEEVIGNILGVINKIIIKLSE